MSTISKVLSFKLIYTTTQSCNGSVQRAVHHTWFLKYNEKLVAPKLHPNTLVEKMPSELLQKAPFAWRCNLCRVQIQEDELTIQQKSSFW
jgi:hypothetical protein